MRDHVDYTVSGNYENITICDNCGPTSLQVDGKLEVQGRDVIKELDEMRDALLLLKRDVDMEAKYPELAEAKREYEKILDKYKTWDAINYGNQN